MHDIITTSYGRCVIDLENEFRVLSADAKFAILCGHNSEDDILMTPLKQLIDINNDFLNPFPIKENFPYYGKFIVNNYKTSSGYYYGICYKNKDTSHLVFDFVLGNNNLIENIPGGIVISSLRNNRLFIEYSNAEFYALLGLDEKQQFLFENYEINADDVAKFISTLAKLNSQDSMYLTTIRSFNKTFLINAKLYRYINDIPVFYFVFTDVTLRMELEQHLMDLNSRYRLVHENSNEMIFDFFSEEDCLYISSPHFEERFHAMRFDKFIENFKENKTIHEKDNGRFLETFMSALKQPKKGFIEYRTDIFSKGKMTWHQASYISIANKEGKVYRIMGIITNITEDKERVMLLEEQSLYKSLTTILNKEAVEAKINEIIDLNIDDVTHAVMIIDIDNFTLIKRLYGIGMGEHIVSDTIRKIKNIIRGSDFLGRLEEDVFIVFIKQIDKNSAEQRANRICENTAEHFSDGENQITISCSIGISYFGIDAFNFDALLDKAYKAMHKAKSLGKNTYVSFGSINKNETEHYVHKNLKIKNKNYSYSPYYNAELIDRAHELIYNTKRFANQMKVIITRLLQKYHFERVLIYQYEFKSEGVIENHYFRYDKAFRYTKIDNNEASEDVKDLLKQYDEKGIYIVNDTSIIKNDIVAISYIKKHNAKSYISFLCHSHDGYIHFVTFIKTKEIYQFNEYDINTLHRMARICVFLQDLKNEKEVNETKIKELLSKDILTNAYNFETFRKIYTSKISKLRSGKIYAVVNLDISNFSYINKQFGDHCGDKVLKYVVELFSTIHPETIIARICNDNFILLFPIDMEEEVEVKFSRLNRIFIKQMKEKYPGGNIGFVVGIFIVKDSKIEVDEAVKNSGFAREAIKKNYVQKIKVYTMRDQLIRENEKNIEINFHTALKNNEFQLYIQPKFDLKTKVIIGAEILTRWINRYGAMQSPMRFIPILEKLGYIVALDFYIYEETLKLMQKWHSKGHYLPISINFSRRHIDNSRFVTILSEMADKYQIDRNLIEVEITENAFVDDNAKLLSCLKNLKAAGFKISMDDFGTGYSSLSLLLKAPIDIIKIDKSFISEVETSDEQQKYLLQITKLIQFANKEIIFEGVETTGQAQFLIDHGFNYAQGYLVSQPLKSLEFEMKFLIKKNN